MYTDLRRYALSVLVNHLLGHTEKSQRIPFDFLINGTILRTSLDEYLSINGISAETVLHAEYIPAFVPPKYVTSFEHDAWVSSVDISRDSKFGQPLILSGSYDGLVRVWNASAQIIATSGYLGDSRFVSATKAAKFVSSTRLVSAGMDRTIRLWRYKEPEITVGKGASISHEADLHHHNQMVLALDVQVSEQRLLSASADHTLAFWNTDLASAPAHTSDSTASAKRQKKSSSSTNPAQVAPLSVLRGHTHHVTGVLFSPHASNQAYSISSDNTLKTWSTATASVIDNRQLADPLYSLTAITNMHLLAVGSSKGDITLLDPRTSTASIKVSTIRQAHTSGFVSSLTSDPTSQYRFASGGFDGLVKVWDIRSLTGSAASIDRRTIDNSSSNSKGTKIFAVKWDSEIGILSAGSDSKIRIDR